MSVSLSIGTTTTTLSLRAAIDPRPPAQDWVAAVGDADVPPEQPPLLGLDAEPRLGASALAGPPTASRAWLTLDSVPGGFQQADQPAECREACAASRWFAQLLIEAVDGRRPLEALGCWLDDWVMAEVARRARLRRPRGRRGTGEATRPTTVASLRVQFSAPTVLEVSAHLRRGPRSAAMAFRLARTDQRWRCTALQLG
ncbi:MAG: Rv3235 family protein [Microlunatus sp.]|nr:Rv3235 family protein [Microlunatus sp.]MDN5769835.1 Rv3235 family protein [Microlunatus sp.]MDN5803371.1 Rv3235 family protein [Microlunatus sp.]